MLRHQLDLETWDKTTTGGLTDEDRKLLAEIYGEANSVFEDGLGESTYIANHVGVARYAGIDSDAAWVANTRKTVATHFRFYFADIGETLRWGFPKEKLPKNVLDYQVIPLISEPQPFDVYMVDGRWRLPCLLLSFLHAHARIADPSQTTVLLRDCFEKHSSHSTHSVKKIERT
jgi:protein O-GlcNAc transferase